MLRKKKEQFRPESMSKYFSMGSFVSMWCCRSCPQTLTACSRLSPLLTACSRLSPFLTACSRLSPLLTACSRLSPLLTACSRLSPFLTACSHLSPFLTACSRLSPSDVPGVSRRAVPADGRPRPGYVGRPVVGRSRPAAAESLTRPGLCRHHPADGEADLS